MTNLTLQPYSTKLAKHQPPDWRHPTEKKNKKKEKEKKKKKKSESAGIQKKKKKKEKEREEVTCFKLFNPRPQVTVHKNNKQQQQKTRACPGVTAGGESEQSSPLDGQR